MSSSATNASPATVDARARSERRRWFLQLWLARLAIGLVAVAAWQALGTWVVERFWISSPLEVGERLVELAANGDLLIHLWATLEVSLYGLGLGMLVGVPLGMSLGLLPRVAAVLEPYVMIFYTLPRIALAPLFIMYLGVGVTSKVTFTFTIVVFVVLLNIQEGVRSVDPELTDALKTMRASTWQVIRWVILPSIVPWALATFRIGVGLALVGAVVAELISASRGLGWYMQRSAGLFDVTGVFAGMLILAFTAAMINFVATKFERRLLVWRRNG